jgi:hypothetical protein
MSWKEGDKITSVASDDSDVYLEKIICYYTSGINVWGSLFFKILKKWTVSNIKAKFIFMGI